MAEGSSRQRYQENLQGEVDSAALYRTLAQTEKNPQLAGIYSRLAAVEEAHAEFWKRQLASLGQHVPRLRPGFRTRALSWLARRFGAAFVLPTVNTLEQMDSGSYADTAGGRRRWFAGGGALACPDRLGARLAGAGRARRRGAGAARRQASRHGRQCAARRRARRQ